ncbi:hypothetical protein MNBD_BACTEROID02-1894 [hydrothermal vent metagenome]|uniref:DUF493 domain-containing protein n=1 Tax=hydrothermal vent metagenome TaxID=652676 RepID=A0A3B0QUK6_9ZZZZ
MNKESDFFKKLKSTLDDTTSFPSEYMYKFIIPSNQEKIQNIENIFNNLGAVISSKPSKKGKFTSLTIVVVMQSSDQIISKYKEVAQVEGVISL